MRTKSAQGFSVQTLREIKSAGFTLVELLIVIVIIGILAGVLTTIVNPVQQRKNAEDGIRRSNMNKLVTGIEAFRSGEGVYPTEAERTNPQSKLYQIYLKAWPTEPVGSNYIYSQSGDNFGLLVAKAATPGYIKYRSEWGKIDDCTNSDPSSSNCAGTATGPTYAMVQCTSDAASNCTQFCASLGASRTCGNNCSDTAGFGCSGTNLGYMYENGPDCGGCSDRSWAAGTCTADPGRIYCCCSN